MGGIIYDGGYLDGSGGGSVWNWLVVEPVLLMKVYYLQVSMIYYSIV